jgi:hypothetical protein
MKEWTRVDLNSQIITHTTLVRLYHLSLELPKLVIRTSINISKLYLYYFIDQPSKQDLKNIALTVWSSFALHALPLKRILCKKLYEPVRAMVKCPKHYKHMWVLACTVDGLLL